MEKLYDLLEFVPKNSRQPYIDAWNIKRLYGFAHRRQKDAAKRNQRPRDPYPFDDLKFCSLYGEKNYMTILDAHM